jgi:hypothetical protein
MGKELIWPRIFHEPLCCGHSFKTRPDGRAREV